MYDFLRYVLSELQRSFAWVILAGIAALLILTIVYLFYKKKYKGERKFSWRKAFLWLLLAGYAAILLYATILRGSGGFRREWNLHLFRAWREAWNNYSAKNWANVLLNIALFIPMGVLLPMLGKKFRKWYLTIPVGFTVSLGIELFQLITCKGICDIDDLFANTLGAAIGYFLIMTVQSIYSNNENKPKNILVNGCISLALVMSICSVFIVYDIKEYGNLPMAAAYRTDTGNVTWVLDCQLPPALDSLPVYKTQTRTIAECDAFAEDFKKIIGTEYTTVTYYQEAAYYMDQTGDENGAHFLHVFYLDQSFHYTAVLRDDPVWTDASRETIEAALAKYPVMIPHYAEFSALEDGWYSFTVAQHIDGDSLIDGELRCQYAHDGSIRNIKSNLLSYTYHDTVSVISPERAYQLLCAGNFNDEGYFEYKAPTQVRVVSCKLGYAIDTKGFYQPIYYFDLVSDDGGYQAAIMIPAIQ